MPRRCLSPLHSRVASHLGELPWHSEPAACPCPGHRGCAPGSAWALAVTDSPLLGFRLTPEAWHSRWRSSTSSTGTCTCGMMVLCVAAAGLVHALPPLSHHQLQPQQPCPAARAGGGRKAAAAALLRLGLGPSHGFLVSGVSHGCSRGGWEVPAGLPGGWHRAQRPLVTFCVVFSSSAAPTSTVSGQLWRSWRRTPGSPRR